MADEWGAVIIDIDTLYASNTDRMVFAKPFDNGIRILSSDYMTLTLKPPYYGDTVNLQFWKLLGVVIGSYSGGTPFTLTPGYKYKYNYSSATFSIYDSSDVLIYNKSNITSIADMNIDFTILNSHQFEILIDPGDLGGKGFIFPAKWRKKRNPMTIEPPITNGVNNIYLQDRIRPYSGADYDNPSYSMMHIGDVPKVKLKDKQVNIIVKKVNPGKLGALSFAWDINWWKTIPNNDFGRDGFDIDAFKLVKTPVEGVRENLDWLLPILSVNMYPMLLPILRPGESHINRPVYEPWLIMGIPTRETLTDYDDPFDPDPGADDPIPHPPVITVDPEDERFIIPIFDLSPRFV